MAIETSKDTDQATPRKKRATGRSKRKKKMSAQGAARPADEDSGAARDSTAAPSESAEPQAEAPAKSSTGAPEKKAKASRRKRTKKATKTAGTTAATSKDSPTGKKVRRAKRSKKTTDKEKEARPSPDEEEAAAKPAALLAVKEPVQPVASAGAAPEESGADLKKRDTKRRRKKVSSSARTEQERRRQPEGPPARKPAAAPVPAPRARQAGEATAFGAGIFDLEPEPETTSAPPAVQEKPASTEAPRRQAAKSATKTKATRSKQPAKQSKVAELGSPKSKGSGADSGPEMIINAASGDECRIAVIERGRLEELYIERQSAESHVGSIYKGRVTNVEPSIQAVFVDFGQAKNGFLHISDVHPQYFPNGEGVSEDVGRKIPRRDRPPIQKCFRRGRDVVVQVTKEGVGTKGPTLTTYLSIPGRFLVMMPGMSRLGVSRKIEDEAERRSMRGVLNELPLPEGMGFILRTAGLGRTKRELQRDLNYLSRLWKTIAERIRKLRSPAEVYQESDLVIRTIRDVLTSDFKRIVVDNETTAEKAQEFLKIALPRTQNMVELYRDPQPVFHKFGIEDEIDKINSRYVPLPLGGSIVIEPTEAMVAIDVNSGKFRDIDDAEKSAYQINMQAAEEIARQLRLRDLGGLIVCDFIDLRVERYKRDVERCLRNELKKHKERARILRMSQFGLIEMTRQRQRSSIKRSIYTECAHCRGAGMVKSSESMCLEVMRVLQLAVHQKGVRLVKVAVSREVANMVQNQKRAQLHQLEQETNTIIRIRGEGLYATDQIHCECEDERGRPIKSPT